MSHDSKIRIRSQYELDMQNLGLLELRNIMNKMEIRYFLSGGTLLGAIRENNFIKWDWDVEINLLTEEVFEKKNEISKFLETENFEITKFNKTFDSLKWEAKKYGATYEIVGLYKERNWRYRLKKGLKVPSFLFEKYKVISFLGNTYTTFADPEKYLEFCYGDWRTPKRTSNKSDYCSLEHLPKLKFHNRVLNKIKSILN